MNIALPNNLWRHSWPMISCIGIAFFYGLCLLFPPSVNIIVNFSEYRWFQWCISLACLSIPILLFMVDNAKVHGTWDSKLLWTLTVALLISMVHNTRLTLDIQPLFFAATIVYAYRHPYAIRRPSTCHYVLWIYLIWNGISLLWSKDYHYGLRLFNHMVPLLLFSLCFLVHGTTRTIYNRIFKAFWQGFIIACMLSFCSSIYTLLYLHVSIWDIFSLHKSTILDQYHVYELLFAWSGREHPSYNAIWVLGGILAGFYLYEKRLITTLEWLFSCVCGTCLMALMQSRIGIVMAGLVLLGGSLYLLRTHKRMIAIVCIVLTLIATIILVVRPTLPLEFGHDITRIKLLETSKNYIAQHLWLGAGLGGMTSEHLTQAISGFEFAEYAHFYPHNQFLGDAMQGGIIGLILSVALMVAFLVTTLYRRNYWMLLFGISILLFMLIEMPFRFLSGTFQVSLIVYLGMQMPRRHRQSVIQRDKC